MMYTMNTITIYKNQMINKLNDVLNDANETILNSMEYIREQLCTCGVIERKADITTLLPLIALLLMAFTAFTCLILYLIFKFKCFLYNKTVDVHDLVAPHSKRISSKNSSQTSAKSQSRPQSISTDSNRHQTQDNSSNDKTNYRSYSSDNVNTASPTLPINGDNAIPVSKSEKTSSNSNRKEASNSMANECETSNNYDIVLPDTPLIRQQISESKHLTKSKSLNSNQFLDSCRSESLESIDSSDSSVDIPQFIHKNDINITNSSEINNFDVKTRVCDMINQNTEHSKSNKRRGDEYFECFDNTQNGDGMSMHVSHNNINHFEFELSSTETGVKEDNKLCAGDFDLTVNNDNDDSNKKAVTPDASLHNDESRVPSACSSKSDQTFQSSSKESRSLLKSIRKRMSFNKNRPITYRNHETLPKDNNENASIELSSKKKSFRQSFNSLNAFQSSSSSSKDSRSILKSIRKRMSFNKNRPITDQNSETPQKELNETATTVTEDT